MTLLSRHTSPYPIHLLLLSLAITLPACSESDAGDGEVQVTLYGEEFIEQGIPADEMADGWSVSFDTFTVTTSEVQIDGVTASDLEPIDISRPTDGSGHALTTMTVPQGEHSGSHFTLTRQHVVGSATKPGQPTMRFDWTLEKETRYSNCQTTTNVTSGQPATFQLTIHADHLFYDSLVSPEPQVLFQALADADSDQDGDITRAELEAASLGSYDAGNDDTVNNLWDWLEAQSATLGHVDGEGHCDATSH